MSSNGDIASHPAHAPSAALGVGFSSLAHRHGETSSRAESSSMAESRSSGKRSHRSVSSDKSQHVEEHERTSQDIAPRRDDESSPSGSIGQRKRKSGGFLLDSAFANGSSRGTPDSHGKRKAQDGQLHVDKRRFTHSRLSGDSSQRGSPLSREVSMETSNADEHDELRTSRPQSMDPAQLVQMALNLSESRKRHVSNTLQVPLASPKRAVSGPMSNFGTVRSSSRPHRHVSPLNDDSTHGSPSSNKSNLDGPDQSEDFQPADSPMDHVVYSFSPATLARAEKARKYFELASEYRRLLYSLPVLKPDSSASARNDRRPTSADGSVNGDDSRELGRQYNPIQSLRNRRARQREKRPFSAPPDTWQDPETVQKWVEAVESATNSPYYRSIDDRVQLPLYSGEERPSSAGQQQNAKGHRRTDTAGTVIMRPENSWTIEPTELLADAYWTEKDDNKETIETRKGDPIFPRSKRKSTDTPKISVEMYRGREGDAGSGSDSDDMDQYGKPSRRRRLMMPLKTADRRKTKHLRSRSPSTDGYSSGDGRRARTPPPRGVFENIGPLERHMQGLIEQDQRGELSSPEQVASPDRWDTSRMRPHRKSVTRAKRESLDPPGRSSLEVPVVAHNGHHHLGHRRSKSTDGRMNSVGRNVSHAEDLDSEPPSPTVPKHVPTMGMGMNISPLSNSRSSTEGQHSRSSKLPTFASHSRERERHNIGQTDFAEGTSGNLYTIQSASNWRSRSSQESARPGNLKRPGTNDSSLSGMQRVDTASTTGTFNSVRQPASTVGRFLKGGRDRIGVLVRGESKLDRSKRDGMDAGDVSAAHSDIGEDEDLGDANGQLKKRTTDLSGHDSDVSPRGSMERLRPKPKYHLGNLPSFTSSARDKRLQVDTPGSTTSDPMNRLQRAGKSERFDRLAPPRITTPNHSNISNPELAADPEDALEKDCKSYGALGAKWMPAVPVGRPDVQARSRGRHWSIYDMIPLEQDKDNDKVTSRDIARARALLMCSGIKAREIQRRADNPPDQPTETNKDTTSTTGQPFEAVALKDEPLVAARMLSTHLSTSQNNFENLLSHFQNKTAKEIGTRIDDLSHRVAEHLTKLVHDTSDDADAFNVEITTRGPQQVKQVDDAVDAMMRQRRRQFRLLKRAGFKLLEWMVLSIMWWIWFFVVVFNFAKRLFLVVFRFLHWLFVP